MKMIWNAHFRSINKSVVGITIMPYCPRLLSTYCSGRQSWVVATETHGLEGLKYSGKVSWSLDLIILGVSLWYWGEWEVERGSVGASEGGRLTGRREQPGSLNSTSPAPAFPQWKFPVPHCNSDECPQGTQWGSLLRLLHCFWMDAKDCIFLLFLGRCKSLVQEMLLLCQRR